jgi:hypothetical protein
LKIALSRNFVKQAVLDACAVLVIFQVLPVSRKNPPVESELPAPPAVHALLKQACYDCHSNETVWPWYSRVAPVSWLVASDVEEGRRELNFSAWGRYPKARQLKKLKRSITEINDGEMPLWYYLPLHPAARLSETDRNVLLKFFEEQSAVAAAAAPTSAGPNGTERAAVPAF